MFIWVSTRLVGTLRTALREIFDFSHGRGIVKGKLFDALMVVVGGVLFIVNLGITVCGGGGGRIGVNLIGLEGPGLSTFRQISAQAPGLRVHLGRCFS